MVRTISIMPIWLSEVDLILQTDQFAIFSRSYIISRVYISIDAPIRVTIIASGVYSELDHAVSCQTTSVIAPNAWLFQLYTVVVWSQCCYLVATHSRRYPRGFSSRSQISGVRPHRTCLNDNPLPWCVMLDDVFIFLGPPSQYTWHSPFSSLLCSKSET